MRHYSWSDKCVIVLDTLLKALQPHFRSTDRPFPTDAKIPELTLAQKQRSAKFMRINQCGEMAAQALYTAHFWIAPLPSEQNTLLRTAQEEADHFYWCTQRLLELGYSPHSLWLPVWFGGGLLLGLVVGYIHEPWNWPLIAETEYQVSQHLQEQLARLDFADERSRHVIEALLQDELHHAVHADQKGPPLPGALKALMRYSATCAKGLLGITFDAFHQVHKPHE